MELVEVREGLARLRLPVEDRQERGPAAREGPIFYNPAMVVNRDLSSLLVASHVNRPQLDILDGLAASGARGIRYALEAGVPVRIQLNDWNPIAARLLRENAALNGLDDAQVTQRNLGPLLWDLVYDIVDLDPFGSPATFLDPAGRAVRNGGMLCLTATDTTALAGVAVKACRRRYDALPLHGELGHEAALRILAGAAIREAAKHDVGYVPIFSHATDHYYRVALEARRGAQRADASLEQVGMLFLCETCGDRGFAQPAACPTCGGKVRLAGPMWTGPLLDPAVTGAMLARAEAHPLERRDAAMSLLRTLDEEARSPLLFHDLHHAGSRLRLGSPPKARVLEKLAQEGWRVGPVHFEVQGVRTDAPSKEVARIVREAAEEALR